MEPLLVRLGAELIIPLFYTLPENTQKDILLACRVYVPASRDQVEQNYTLWETDNLRAMHLPRGFLPALKLGLGANNISILDERLLRSDPGIHKNPIKLRRYQEPAVQRILEAREGILVAPPGAGKTVMVLEAIRRSQQNALIIVDKKNIAEQWGQRCKEYLGIDVNYVGGDLEPAFLSGSSPITIAMQQTLSAHAINPAFLKENFGFVCLDECHHISAETYTKVFQQFNAYYRIGVSATPTRDDGLEKISKLIIGPVIYSVISDEAKGMRPVIVRKPTYFDHPFWSTHYVGPLEICNVPNCKKNGKRHSHKNNYMQVTKALAEDYDRNWLVAAHVNKNRYACNLIVSDRLGQLDVLREMIIKQGFDPDRVYMLTGRESNEQRVHVIHMAGFGECAILSTIAKEALDIPRLDRLFMAWPIAKDHILEQQIGRIVRPHPDKLDVMVYDFHDSCSALAAQGHKRLNYYNSKGYIVE